MPSLSPCHETLALFKTTAAAYPDFEKSLAEMHPYDVPEIVALEPAKVAAPYLAWLLDAAGK